MADPPADAGPDPAAGMPGPPGIAAAVGRNVAAMSRRRAEDDATASGGVRLSARLGRVIGTMGFVSANFVFYGVWIAVQYGVIPGAKGFDPALALMGSLASVEGIFLAILILITQNHEATANDRRDDLNLQVSLLTEHELTRLIKLTIAVAEKLGINPEAAGITDLQHDVHPDDVLDTIERAEDARKD